MNVSINELSHMATSNTEAVYEYSRHRNFFPQPKSCMDNVQLESKGQKRERNECLCRIKA